MMTLLCIPFFFNFFYAILKRKYKVHATTLSETKHTWGKKERKERERGLRASPCSRAKATKMFDVNRVLQAGFGERANVTGHIDQAETIVFFFLIGLFPLWRCLPSPIVNGVLRQSISGEKVHTYPCRQAQHIHSHTCTRTNTHTHAQTHTNNHTRQNTHTHTPRHTHTHTRTHTYTQLWL